MPDTRLPNFTPEQLEVRRKWREALRSGKYQQGEGLLRAPNNTYCCLGVLCDVLEPSGWTTPEGRSFYLHRAKSAVPSEHIKEAAGIEFAFPYVNANDTRHETFAQIADMIEQEEAAA